MTRPEQVTALAGSAPGLQGEIDQNHHTQTIVSGEAPPRQGDVDRSASRQRHVARAVLNHPIGDLALCDMVSTSYGLFGRQGWHVQEVGRTLATGAHALLAWEARHLADNRSLDCTSAKDKARKPCTIYWCSDRDNRDVPICIYWTSCERD